MVLLLQVFFSYCVLPASSSILCPFIRGKGKQDPFSGFSLLPVLFISSIELPIHYLFSKFNRPDVFNLSFPRHHHPPLIIFVSLSRTFLSASPCWAGRDVPRECTRSKVTHSLGYCHCTSFRAILEMFLIPVSHRVFLLQAYLSVLRAAP